MKRINNYILEKLKINKDITDESCSEWVFVIAFNKCYDKINNIFPEESRIVPNSGEPDGWIIRKTDIKKLPKSNDNEVIIYKIPDNYSNINDFKEDYLNGEIFTEDFDFYEED